MANPTPAYFFDIDGTLADCSHRMHYLKQTPKDWEGFFMGMSADLPIHHMCDLFLSLACHADIVIVTGRPEKWRDRTKKWLNDHVMEAFERIYMRADGDHRDDDTVKPELIRGAMADGYMPLLVFEDRTRVVQAIRAMGIPCCQVAEGDY